MIGARRTRPSSCSRGTPPIVVALDEDLDIALRTKQLQSDVYGQDWAVALFGAPEVKVFYGVALSRAQELQVPLWFALSTIHSRRRLYDTLDVPNHPRFARLITQDERVEFTA